MTQTQSSIEDRIREFLLKHFPLAKKRGVTPTEKWLETGLIDSLGILDLVHFLEEEFAIHIADEELLPETFQSLDAVTAFVTQKRQAKTT